MHGCPQCWGSSKYLKPWTQILIILWSHVYNKLKFPQESDIHIYKRILVAPKFQVDKELFWSLWNNQAKTFCIICMYNYTLFSLVHLPPHLLSSWSPPLLCLPVMCIPLPSFPPTKSAASLLRIPFLQPPQNNKRTHTHIHTQKRKKEFCMVNHIEISSTGRSWTPL